MAVESDRQTLPNMTMGHLSIHNGTTNEANDLNLVNDEIINDHIEKGRPEVIILTDWDWRILQKTANFERIVASLYEHYELQYEQTSAGWDRADIEVYVRREEN